jgi:hypothetical protein
MVWKGLKRGTTFSIYVSSNSSWSLNENSENLLCLNSEKFLLGTSNLAETWTKDFSLHLVTNSTLGKDFEIQLGIC